MKGINEKEEKLLEFRKKVKESTGFLKQITLFKEYFKNPVYTL